MSAFVFVCLASVMSTENKYPLVLMRLLSECAVSSLLAPYALLSACVVTFCVAHGSCLHGLVLCNIACDCDWLRAFMLSCFE